MVVWNRWTRFVSEEIEPGTKNRLRRCSAPRQPAIIPLENLATRNFPPTVGCHLRSAVKHEPARSRWSPWKDGEPHDSFKNRAPAEIYGWDTWLTRVIYATGMRGRVLKSSQLLTRGGDVNVKQESRRIEEETLIDLLSG